MYKYWSFIQKTLIQSRLAEKYQALVSKALISNPVERLHHLPCVTRNESKQRQADNNHQ